MLLIQYRDGTEQKLKDCDSFENLDREYLPENCNEYYKILYNKNKKIGIVSMATVKSLVIM